MLASSEASWYEKRVGDGLRRGVFCRTQKFLGDRFRAPRSGLVMSKAGVVTGGLSAWLLRLMLWVLRL